MIKSISTFADYTRSIIKTAVTLQDSLKKMFLDESKRRLTLANYSVKRLYIA